MAGVRRLPVGTAFRRGSREIARMLGTDAKKLVWTTSDLLNNSESQCMSLGVDLQEKQQNQRRHSLNCILRGIGTALAFHRDYGGGRRRGGTRRSQKLCRGLKGGRSGNSPVPAQMGAWPEREAPAGKSHFGAFLGGKGEGFVLPLFFKREYR